MAVTRMDDGEISALFREHRATGRREVRNRLIEEHQWIARMVVQRFTERGEPYDDLLQVALLGLLKAVDRFDPDHGAAFRSFALPTVQGELRRHFRDRTWAMRVPRDAKELHLRATRTGETLTQQLGRSPTTGELAGELGVSVDRLLQSREAGGAYRTAPIHPRDDGPDEDRILACVDEALSSCADRVLVRKLVNELPKRERTILYLRFYKGLSQRSIAEVVGVSQVHVSRLLRTTLTQLAAALAPEATAAAG